MPDDPRIPRDDEDAAFRDWLHKRPNPPEDVPASVTFMEIMRQAAARSSAEQGGGGADGGADSGSGGVERPDPANDSGPRPDDSTTPYTSPEDRPRRRRTSPPPLTSADISAAVRAAGEDFARAAESTPATASEKSARRAMPRPETPKDPTLSESGSPSSEPADIERPATQSRRRIFQRAPADPALVEPSSPADESAELRR
ncbi:MAG: hypothetical protein U0670_04865 [Anaerolineae bacterium]